MPRREVRSAPRLKLETIMTNRAYVVCHGLDLGLNHAMVPKGSTVAFYADVDSILPQSIALAVMTTGSVEARQTYPGATPLPNYLLSELTPDEAAKVITSASTQIKGSVYLLGNSSQIGKKRIPLCTDTKACQTEVAKNGKHAKDCKGLLSLLKETEIHIVACRTRQGSRKATEALRYTDTKVRPYGDSSTYNGHLKELADELLTRAKTGPYDALATLDSLPEATAAALLTVKALRMWVSCMRVRSDVRQHLDELVTHWAEFKKRHRRAVSQIRAALPTHRYNLVDDPDSYRPLEPPLPLKDNFSDCWRSSLHQAHFMEWVHQSATNSLEVMWLIGLQSACISAEREISSNSAQRLQMTNLRDVLSRAIPGRGFDQFRARADAVAERYHRLNAMRTAVGLALADFRFENPTWSDGRKITDRDLRIALDKFRSAAPSRRVDLVAAADCDALELIRDTRRLLELRLNYRYLEYRRRTNSRN